MSYRKIDMSVEREIAKYMDSRVFNVEGGDFSYVRTDGKGEQFSGSDGLLTCERLSLKDAVVDEKSAHQYVNTGIENFGLELSFIRRDGTLSDGWFLKDGLSTQYYMFYWVWAKVPWKSFEEGRRPVPQWEKITSENITGIEFILVGKKEIRESLEGMGFGKERLVRAAEWFRANPDQFRKESKRCGFFFMVSRQFDECPVNLFLSRSFYASLSLAHGWVTPKTKIMTFTK